MMKPSAARPVFVVNHVGGFRKLSRVPVEAKDVIAKRAAPSSHLAAEQHEEWPAGARYLAMQPLGDRYGESPADLRRFRKIFVRSKRRCVESSVDDFALAFSAVSRSIGVGQTRPSAKASRIF